MAVSVCLETRSFEWNRNVENLASIRDSHLVCMLVLNCQYCVRHRHTHKHVVVPEGLLFNFITHKCIMVL